MAETFDLDAAIVRANNGDAVMQLVLGDYYSKHPEESERRYTLAMSWYEASFKSGYALAAYRIGELYEKGIGRAESSSLALTWYKRGSDAGCPACSAKLMFVFENGQLGIERNQNLVEHYQNRMTTQSKENESYT